MTRPDDAPHVALVAEFRELVAEAARLRARRSIGPANLRITKSHGIAEQLLADEDGRRAFSALLFDEDPWVRIDAAGRLLPDRRARQVLEGLAAGSGRAAFDARMQLRAEKHPG